MGLGLQQSEAKARSEYVMTLIDCYAEEHSKNIELRTTSTHFGGHLIIKERPFLPPLSTQTLPSKIILDKKCGGSYHHLTSQRGDKLARGIAKLLFEDAALCGCSDQVKCLSYSEVMSVFEAGAWVAFERLHHGFCSDFQQSPVLEDGGQKVDKLSPRRWWKPYSWQWPNRAAVYGKQSDRKNEKPTIMPKRMQVKYIKKH
ncbi:unnamed protein product [Macrosiphum euphorbiae]|uniref:Uncharacterized protein n=1 Tax=Macrosiphum euphorbiae TaxID=13131 RepID=A0AAV0X6V1_9HEMI|nr:unnamed protein product [Macrosiphum euphorbiae]